MTVLSADGLTVLESGADDFSSDASEDYLEGEDEGYGAPNGIC